MACSTFFKIASGSAENCSVRASSLMVSSYVANQKPRVRPRLQSLDQTQPCFELVNLNFYNLILGSLIYIGLCNPVRCKTNQLVFFVTPHGLKRWVNSWKFVTSRRKQTYNYGYLSFTLRSLFSMCSTSLPLVWHPIKRCFRVDSTAYFTDQDSWITRTFWFDRGFADLSKNLQENKFAKKSRTWVQFWFELWVICSILQWNAPHGALIITILQYWLVVMLHHAVTHCRPSRPVPSRTQ